MKPPVGDVLILGGYGNFGKRIAAGLARHGAPIVIAGRHRERAEALAHKLRADNPQCAIGTARIDAEQDLDAALLSLQPTVVVNTCGPFQNKDYRVAQACIRQRAAYIDLAEGRDFVTGITRLDEAAKAAGVAVISGASTVPGLSSAVVEHFKPGFAAIDELKFGVSPGQKAERGLATSAGILGYVGKKLKPMRGQASPRYGWQDIHQQEYPELGPRWMANCDIPDLDLFPDRYGIQSIRFSAGMEVSVLHLGLFALSWIVRSGIPLDLARHAALLLRASHWFDRFGSGDGGMHVIMRGRDQRGGALERSWFIVAKSGDGPQIPCVPAILLARKLSLGEGQPAGARACVGLIALPDYLAELKTFAVKTYEF